MSRILLVGSGGLLGTAFKTALSEDNAICPDRSFVDLTEPGRLMEMVSDIAPAIVINCAADTDVEGAEANPDKAFAVNALLPDLLAQACRRAGVRMVHFSSTGCYGTHSNLPYDDFADQVPTTVHHRSKVAGEGAVRSNLDNALILRLGWLYGGGISQRRNFVWARIQEARGKPEIMSDPSQTGSPTCVDDVVRQTLRLMELGFGGTFNCVATGAVTRLDYVARILHAAGSATELRPMRFSRKAAVSPNEAAVNTKLRLMGLNLMPPWEEAVDRYVRSLLASEHAASGSAGV